MDPLLSGLLVAFAAAVFAAIMAAYSGARHRRDRLAELRRRLGAPIGEDALYDEDPSRLGRVLSESGLPWTQRLLIQRSVVAAAAGVLVAAILGSIPLALLLGIGGAASQPLYVLSVRQVRLTRCDEQLPQALQLMVLALRAGHALPGALALAAREAPSPLGDELRRAVDEHGLGRPMGEVVTRLAIRLPESSTMQTFAVAVLVLEQTGGNLIEVVERIVENARARTQYQAKLRALTTQGRWSAWILCGMPIAFGVLASLLDPNFARALFGSPAILFLFFGLWIPGIAWTVRLVRQGATQ
jgi:tight adherence protein B